MRMLHALVIIGLILSLTTPAAWSHSPAQPDSQVTPPPATATTTPTAPPATAGADAPTPTPPVMATLPATPTPPGAAATPPPTPVLTATLPTPALSAETTTPTTTPVPTITPTAALTATTAIVGPEGGALTSADGRVTVQFPAGAVATAVTARYGRGTVPADWALAAFSLTAYETARADAPVRQFQVPLTISVRLGTSLPADERLVKSLALWTWSPTLERWIRLPSEVDVQAGTLTAQTTHFSDFAAGGGDPLDDVPLPSINDFDSDLFTGAASVRYPLAVPAGNNGLAPQLELSYNSATADGLQHKYQISWVGQGWSLDLPYIMRKGTSSPNYFLVWNGAKSKLLQGTPEGDHVPFQEEKQKFWRIWRPVGGDDVTWQVWDQSGTRYDFGIVYAGGEFGERSSMTPIGGDAYVYRWSLARIVDTHGNQVTFEYDEHHRNNICDNLKYESGDVAVYPTRILYGGNNHQRYEILFNRAERSDYEGDCEEPNVWWDDTAFAQKDRLENIVVRAYNPATAQMEIAWKYVLTYNQSPPENDTGRLTLKEIERYGRGGTGTPLPAYEFTYEDLYFPSGDHVTLLNTAANGYGGVVDYGYDDVYVYCIDGNCIPGLKVYKSQLVTKAVADGLGQSHTYNYAYVYGYDPEAVSQFMGYQQVTVTDPVGHQTQSWFYQNNDEIKQGRSWKTERKNESGQMLSRSQTAYAHISDPLGWNFVYVQQADNWLEDMHTHAIYAYDDYGNQTEVREYGDGSSIPYRTTLRGYYPGISADTWLVSLPGWENVYAGDPYNGGTLQASTSYCYDGHEFGAAPGPTGDLTRVRRLIEFVDTNTEHLAEATYQYNSYGHRTHETVYAGASTWHWNGSLWECTGQPTDPRTTETVYGNAIYPAYATQVKLPLVNGVLLGTTYDYDWVLGLVTQVTDANNLSTWYQYDEHGRVLKVKLADDPSPAADPTWSQYSAQRAYFRAGYPDQHITTWRGRDTAQTWEELFFNGLGQRIQVHQKGLG
ncbi:MAG: hypothetical protein KKB13_31085, partial [Chloroflexi bacterium]|nr:hypothetical protein [Chloroflexota bacterium]